MLDSLFGKKLGMMQIFSEDGNVIPATIVQLGPCPVVQKKTLERDGYHALQLGFEDVVKVERINKPKRGHFGKAGVPPTRYLQEIRVDEADEYEEGQVIKVEEIFQQGDLVDVMGVSKGKGFTGVMKRHGFSGQPAGHGTHESFRGPGSIGAAAYPGKVFKGTKLPGRMGGARVTVQNLQVVQVLGEQNVMVIKGPVPGARGGLVKVSISVKRPEGGRQEGKE